MNFGQAIEALKDNQLVQRSSWNVQTIIVPSGFTMLGGIK